MYGFLVEIVYIKKNVPTKTHRLPTNKGDLTISTNVELVDIFKLHGMHGGAARSLCKNPAFIF